MEVFVDRTGRRVFINSPAPDQSEWASNTFPYSPNTYDGLNCGLYERSRPSCTRWVDSFHQMQKKYGTRPQYSVDRDGRTTYPASRFNPNYPPYYPAPYRQ